MAALGAFLDRMGREGWEWGQRDCLQWLGLWSLEVVGLDGCEAWRGRYRTALGCTRLLNRLGGIEACVEAGAARVGASEVGNPMAGDIGLVLAPTSAGPKPTGCIFTGQKAALLTGRGILTIKADPIRAWRFP